MMDANKLIPVISEYKALYYVSESEFIKFIILNSDIEYFECREYIKKYHLVNAENKTLWYETDLILHPEEYNSEQIKWIGLFFKAHPFMDKIMIVFDD
jgi:hypothetical protein